MRGYELGAIGSQGENMGFLRAQLQGRLFPKLWTHPLARLEGLGLFAVISLPKGQFKLFALYRDSFDITGLIREAS